MNKSNYQFLLIMIIISYAYIIRCTRSMQNIFNNTKIVLLVDPVTMEIVIHAFFVFKSIQLENLWNKMDIKIKNINENKLITTATMTKKNYYWIKKRRNNNNNNNNKHIDIANKQRAWVPHANINITTK